MCNFWKHFENFIFMIRWLRKRTTTQSFTNWGRNVDISCIYVYLCIPIKQNEGSRVSRELMLLLSSHLQWCLHFCLSKPFSTSSLLHYVHYIITVWCAGHCAPILATLCMHTFSPFLPFWTVFRVFFPVFCHFQHPFPNCESLPYNVIQSLLSVVNRSILGEKAVGRV